jgi:AraC-like DNA-binding protein
MASAFTRQPSLETVPGAKYQAFKFHRFARPRFDFIWHHHPEVELTYILHGHGVRYVGNSIRPFHAGDLCLIGANTPHAYGSHPRMRGGAQWIVVHFLPDRFGPQFWKLSDTRALRQLLDSSRRGIRYSGRGLDRCVRLLKGLDRARSSLGALSGFFQVLDLLRSIEGRDFLNPCDASLSHHASIDPRLQKVLAWMESVAPVDLSQRNAARLTGMSPAAFSRFFRTHTDRTFVRHLNELRIARACVSLAAEDRRIMEVALESGFENLSNFNRRFREIVGMSPREYQASRSAVS